MQAVIKSYDGPIPVSLSSSLHNVASGREREGNGIGYFMGRVEHMNSVGQRHHHLMPNQKLAGGVAMRSGPQVTMGAYSESNLLVLSSQQHKYSSQHNTQHKSAFLYGNMGKYICGIDTLKNIQINCSVLYDLLQTESRPTSFICTPFNVRLLPCGLTLKYTNSSPDIVLPITFENYHVWGKKFW